MVSKMASHTEILALSCFFFKRRMTMGGAKKEKGPYFQVKLMEINVVLYPKLLLQQ